MIEQINTDRLVLREWRYSDFVPFSEMNADSDVMKYFPNTLTKGASDIFAHRIIAEMNAKGFGLFAVELKSTGAFIGYVGLHEIAFDAGFKGEIEIGWRLDKRYWNKGYATEAAQAVLDFAKKTGLKKLYSFTAAVNLQSERVMQKIGMEKVGKFEHPSLEVGHWLRQHVLYEITL